MLMQNQFFFFPKRLLISMKILKIKILSSSYLPNNVVIHVFHSRFTFLFLHFCKILVHTLAYLKLARSLSHTICISTYQPVLRKRLLN